jgi:hypothetical protein
MPFAYMFFDEDDLKKAKPRIFDLRAVISVPVLSAISEILMVLRYWQDLTGLGMPRRRSPL